MDDLKRLGGRTLRNQMLLLRLEIWQTNQRNEGPSTQIVQGRLDERQFVYRLEHSKTQQAGPSATSTPDKPILGIVAEALAAWIEASGLQEGRIFRRLWGDRIGAGLSPAAIAAIVQ